MSVHRCRYCGQRFTPVRFNHHHQSCSQDAACQRARKRANQAASCRRRRDNDIHKAAEAARQRLRRQHAKGRRCGGSPAGLPTTPPEAASLGPCFGQDDFTIGLLALLTQSTAPIELKVMHRRICEAGRQLSRGSHFFGGGT